MPIAVRLRGYRRVDVESISKPIVSWIGERKSFKCVLLGLGMKY